MSKEEYKAEYENLEYDFWFYNINDKVARLNELIDGRYITDEIAELDTIVKNWNLRCCKLLREYDAFIDKTDLESPQKYILSKEL